VEPGDGVGTGQHAGLEVEGGAMQPVRLAGAGLFRDKSTVGWLLVAGLL
jgi:hypothetical protein